MKDTMTELDEEFLPAWAQGPFASRMAQRSALACYLADARTSSNPRERLFATLDPWIRAQIKRYQRMRDGSIQFKGEVCSQTFRMLLWESIVEWDREKSNSNGFVTNPTGVVIHKTQAKIRHWYQEERRRYWIERTLIQDIDDDWMSRDEYIGGWKKEAEQAAAPRDRRYAEKVVRILSTIGDAADREMNPHQDDLVREVRERARAAELAQLQVALRCGVVNEDEFKLLTGDRIHAPDRTAHARLRQRRSRARRRFLAWRKAPDGSTVLVREGLLLGPDELCWFLAAVSKPSRRIPQETIDQLRQELFALPGGQAAWERFVAAGHLDDAWMDFNDDAPDGFLTWGDLGFPEADAVDD